MASNLKILAIMKPAAGKSGLVIEALKAIVEFAKISEPETLSYEITQEVNKESGIAEIITIESYINKAAFDAHMSSVALKEFQRRQDETDFLDAPIEFKLIQVVGGFASK